jgi:hypothetical protein|tara:strand:+ start:1077 stop:3332 length:2256 start_codon:yes stop_codon:yes gene_type:complete
LTSALAPALLLVALGTPTLAQASGQGSRAVASSPAPPLSLVQRDAAGNVTLRAIPVAEGLVVDGRLDEPTYEEIEPAGDFVQQEPIEGAAATEPTEAWILYDDDNLYVSARLWDSSPERMVANELRRDHRNIRDNESFAVVLDTFHDRRNGFFFQTNALGALRDGLITDERNANFDWNTVWDVRTGEFENGWTLEMVIPFKSLRFRGQGDQVWGINLHRFVRWKNEHSFVNPVPASYGEEGIYRMSSAGTLVDLRLQTGSRTLEIKPYGISSVSTDATVTPDLTNDFDAEGGLDAKYNLTKGLTADFTYNTDFAQVEADDEQVNLTRFNLFFPEKREFFLEGQGLFEFGGPERVIWGRPSNAPVVFFSRRIGLDDGHEIPLNVGGRVTGRAGKYTVGALAIQTGDEADLGVESTNFSVVRIRRDVFRRSTIGIIGTHRSVGLDGGGSNQVFGTDASLAFFQNLSITGYWARSQTDGRDGRDYSYRGRLENLGDRYGVEYEHLVVGEGFNPEVGFLRRRNFRRNYMQVQFTPRPDMPSVRKFRNELSFDYIETMDGQLESRELRYFWAAEFQRGDEWWLWYERDFEFLSEPFEVADGIVLPVGPYSSDSFLSNYNLGPQRPINGWLGFIQGSFFGGTRTQARYFGRVELSPVVSIEPRIAIDWIDLPQGSFVSKLVSGRFNYTISPRSFFSALLQYNSGSDSFGTNIRFRWEYQPGSDLFVVYTEGRNTDERGFPMLQNRGFVVKFTRLFRF